MADQNVQLAILLEVRQALQSMQEFEKQAAQSATNVEKAFSTLKGIAGGVAAAFVIDKIRDFASESVKAASDQEAAQRRLATALSLTGDYSDEAFHGMVEFADQLEKTSRFSDGTITAQLAVAKSFGASNEQAKLLVQTAADMASQLGTDLPEQVEKLGKTLSGNAGRLAQNYKELNQFSEAQLQAGAAVEFLGNRFRGAAESDIHTYEGATLQAHNAVEDFQKALGHLVTDSPVATARIESMTKTFRGLTDWVERNKDELQALVDGGFRGLVLAAPAALDVAISLQRAFQGLAHYGGLAAFALADIADFIAQAFSVGIQVAVDVTLGFVKTLVDVANAVPGVGDGLKGMGVDLEALSDGLVRAGDGIDSMVENGANQVGKLRDSIGSFVSTADENFAKTNIAMDRFAKGVHEAAQVIVDADADTSASAKKAGENRENANNKAARSAKETAKLIQELAQLDQKIFSAETDPAKKAQEEFQNFVDEVGKLEKQRILTRETAEERLVSISSIYADKLLKIHEKNQKEIGSLDAALFDQTADAEAKAFKQYQGFTEEIAKLRERGVLDEEGARQRQEQADEAYYAKRRELAAQPYVNALSAAFGSEDGKQAANKFGETMITEMTKSIPIFGPIIGAAAHLLFEDPKLTEAFFESFIASLPNMIATIAKNIPAIVEGVFKGVYDLTQQAGKALGTSFGDSLTSTRIFETVPREWKKDLSWLDDVGIHWGKSLDKSFAHFGDILQLEGDRIRIGFKDAPAEIARGFRDGTDYLGTHFSGTASASADKFFDAIQKGGEDFFKGVGKPFADAGKTFVDALAQFFSGAFSQIKFPEFQWPKIEEPAWLKTFVDAVKDLTSFGGLTTGGSGGGGAAGKIGGFIGGLAHHARGLSEVPSGYGNDDYFAGLTSGEGVVDAETNPGLKRMAADYAAGKLTASTDVLLARVIALLEQPMTIETTAQVDRRAFADIQLQLSRQNARTA